MATRGEYVYVHTTGSFLAIIDVEASLDKGLLDLEAESRCAATTLGSVRNAIRRGNALIDRTGNRVYFYQRHAVALSYHPPRSER